MSALSIFAGPTALQRIRQDGIQAQQFQALVGASGGPKWFVLYGLDRYLFGDFFTARETPLYTLGSSAGAWRLCCLPLADPVAAIERLAMLYSGERYSNTPTVAEITSKARAMLRQVLGADGARQIVDHPSIKTHIVTARCRGPGALAAKPLQAGFLGLSAAANVMSRHSLTWFFQRTVFSSMGADSPWHRVPGLPATAVRLRPSNVEDAMIASGSIPFVLEGVRDIDGAPRGLYWDGGIIDYHFDQLFHAGSELVLYPHFSPRVIPGWFDKHLPWRNIHPANFHNVVLLTPSREFVDSLPNRKIPDRQDFQAMDYERRVAVWREVLGRSEELAAEFAELVETGRGVERVQLFAGGRI